MNFDLEFPTPLSEIEDIFNDNIDVFVKLNNGLMLTLVVTTPLNYLWYMDKEGTDFIEASPPDIIVRKLTYETIRCAIETFVVDDAYWLKYYFLAGRREIFDPAAIDTQIPRISDI